MAGIYIHIPFCKQACHYCDFHFSTSLKYKDEMLAAILKEIQIQKNYLEQEKIETIYFGGGTPSILSETDLNHIFQTLYQTFEIAKGAEITLEANPDDLNLTKIKALRNTPINRFSIGVQSFFEEDLKWMNRAHEAKESEYAIKTAQDAGFENITIDLIYGYPLLSDEKWLVNINQTLALDIQHISCYSMTVEQKTALASFVQKGLQKPMDDAQSARQFKILMEKLAEQGFEHYEISNFAKNKNYSKHNTNYWKGVKYLGIGPSAHSFNGISRQWNIANNAKYIDALMQDTIPFEIEELSFANRFNEYVMTSLRTMWGINLHDVINNFGANTTEMLKQNIEEFVNKGWVKFVENHFILTPNGKLYADHIAAELFIEDHEL